MKINQPAVAGTLESGDVMIRIAPLDTQDIDLQINSSVEKQFGDAIRTTILDVLARYNVRGVQLNVDDKGALDCIFTCTTGSPAGTRQRYPGSAMGGLPMISASLQQRKTRTRRSMLFVPGANAAMVSNSFIYPADALMFDLEDSVALREKDTARRMVYHALQHPLYRDIETIVRVNALDSEWGVNDLEAVVRGGADVVRLPKTDTAQDVLDIEKEILRIEKACGREPGSTGLLAAIESPLGITRAVEIAHASERLIGIALGAEDYVRNLRTERSPEGTELLFARCSILQAARSAGIQAFDTVYSDANNEAGFLQEAAHIKQLGFDGKSLINPRQIDLLHNLYAPTQKEVDHARRVVEAAEAAAREGLGVVSLNGKMVDGPVIDRARLVLSRAELSGIREE